MRLRTLARNETIKLGRDRSLWITLAGMAALVAIGVGSTAHVLARNPDTQPLSLPTAWPLILGSAGGVLAFFTSVAVILLVTSEFRWGTARQHLVAGLSRDELYLAKALVLVATVLLFFATGSIVGGAFAVPHTPIGHATLIRPEDARYMAGTLLDVTGYGSLAFLLAIALRRSGAAIGVFFLYILLEQVAGAGLAKLKGALHVVPRYLPAAVFSSLHRAARYYPAAPPAGGRGAPPSAAASATVAIPTGPLVLLAVAYLTAFLVAAYLILRRRDL